MSYSLILDGNHHDFDYYDAVIMYIWIEDLNTIEISSLRVPSRQRNSGSARMAMEAFLKLVDAQHLRVELIASPLDKRTKLGRLVMFYKSLGFEVDGVGNMAGEPVMVRRPR